MIISIDPGITGAVSIFNDVLIDVFDLPVSEKTFGKGKQINATLLNAEFHALPIIQKAIIERVSARPGQGVTSVFGFGRTIGVIEGILAANQIPIQWVTPQKWKKHFSLLKKDKDSARTLVIEKYPDWQDTFKRKKDHGRADSVLIGLYYLETAL